MNTKQKIIVFLATVVASLVLVAGQPALALNCGEAETSIIGGGMCEDVDEGSGDTEDSAVWALLILALNIMTAGIGILAVGGIVYGSILYASAADKAEQTKKAISIILNVVLGLVAYAMMYLVLNYLIPGGIFY